MMFIKPIFALYFSAIALAAPTPQLLGGFLGGGGDGPGLPRGLPIIGDLPVVGGLLGDGEGGSILDGGGGGEIIGGGGGGGRLRTSCLNSRPLVQA
jgi:hypothetical protein